MIPINGKTQILGIIGNPIAHTASPQMHNAMLEHLSLNYIYIPFKIEPNQLQNTLTAVRAMNIKGLNVTIPFKEQVIPFLDALDISAKQVGAVNTIINQNGHLTGYNTDGSGFITSLKIENNTDVRDKRCVIIGAGGSAKSIGFALLEHGAKSLMILNRTLTNAKALKSNLEKYYQAPIFSSDFQDKNQYDMLQEADIIINTTPIGMDPHINQTPIEAFDWVLPQHLICDIIYKPKETLFLKKAKEKKAKIGYGYGMLVGQGILAFELFTQHKADYNLMKAEVLNR